MSGRIPVQPINGSLFSLSSPLPWLSVSLLPSSFFSSFSLLVALFFLIAGHVPPLFAEDLGLITSVRTLTTDGATRVILDLSRLIPYQLTTEPPSSAQRANLTPASLHITFSSATFASGIPSTLRVNDALLTSVRRSQMSPTMVRISLELTGMGTYRALDLRSPYQVVIVLRKASLRSSHEVAVSPLTQRRKDAETRTREEKKPRVVLPPPPLLAPLPAEDTTEAPDPSESPLPPVSEALATRRYRIMLDPGHGGHDPGAGSLHGIWEKNVVLAISKRLEKKLQARLPVEVMLTRNRDVFLSLPERTARANAAKADLFISIHANSSPNSATHGIETYYLNNTNDRATLRLARLENSSRERTGTGPRGRDLALILSDLIQTGKSEESIALAQSLQRSLVNQARTHYPDARNLGVKRGPFYVLVGAHMPCVLVETAFLSHAIEGKRLETVAYQEVLAEGLFQGIARFLRDSIAGNL